MRGGVGGVVSVTASAVAVAVILLAVLGRLGPPELLVVLVAGLGLGLGVAAVHAVTSR